MKGYAGKDDGKVTELDIFETAWGWAAARYTRRGVTRLVLPRPSRGDAEKAAKEEGGAVPAVVIRPWEELRREIRDYFEGRKTGLSMPLVLRPPGEFTGRVWQAVRRIPYGDTVTYGEVAGMVGRRNAARAVGGAMARNPLPLFVP